MPNYGLLNNIATGMREGLITYQTMQNMKNQQAQMENAQRLQNQQMRMQAAQHGLIESTDPTTGETNYTKDPEAIKREIALWRAKNPFEGMDPEVKKAKEKLGAEYGEYAAQGGDAAVQTDLESLQSAIDDLSGPDELSGGISGLLGDKGQDVFAPKSAAVRDKIRSAVAGSVKKLFPGPVSDYESKSVMERAYNPRLSDEENIRRATVELNRLKRIAKSKSEAFNPVSEKLGGRGLMKESTKVNKNSENEQAQSSKPKPGAIINHNGKRYRVGADGDSLEEI